ncbi:ribosomal maturation YjgA family protein [Pedobacter africanus]|uniref:DUF2809 domain-containing protein n=1 Tax=Pedobacter africanus TaxID=151894 RepID=A0A1W2CNZ0_9SPHI|nr:DUF2809 domain-containing protein [Pedobacter africanus]SMC86911.1 Protein of unknown function [Pedobacter africanus]
MPIVRLKTNIKALRFRYLILILVVIALGILSRKVTGIPLIVGDILYAVMMFFLVKMLLIRLSYLKAALISVSVCFLIEFSQLYNATWINNIRNTTLGALVLGHGFLWSDIIAYTIGTVVIYKAVCLLNTR